MNLIWFWATSRWPIKFIQKKRKSNWNLARFFILKIFLKSIRVKKIQYRFRPRSKNRSTIDKMRIVVETFVWYNWCVIGGNCWCIGNNRVWFQFNVSSMTDTFRWVYLKCFSCQKQNQKFIFLNGKLESRNF